MKDKIKSFLNLFRSEKGIATVEIILILVVLVGLVILFKSEIGKVVSSLFDKISTQTSKL